jgi:hypothetical protein
MLSHESSDYAQNASEQGHNNSEEKVIFFALPKGSDFGRPTVINEVVSGTPRSNKNYESQKSKTCNKKQAVFQIEINRIGI